MRTICIVVDSELAAAVAALRDKDLSSTESKGSLRKVMDALGPLQAMTRLRDILIDKCHNRASPKFIVDDKSIDILKLAVPDGVEICRKPVDMTSSETCHTEIRGKPVRLSRHFGSHYRKPTYIRASVRKLNGEGDQEAELAKAFSEELNV